MGANQGSFESLTDKAMRKMLETIQTGIVLLVDQENDILLTHLQSCVGELFRRAAVCRAEGKRMKIVDDDPNLH